MKTLFLVTALLYTDGTVPFPPHVKVLHGLRICFRFRLTKQGFNLAYFFRWNGDPCRVDAVPGTGNDMIYRYDIYLLFVMATIC